MSGMNPVVKSMIDNHEATEKEERLGSLYAAWQKCDDAQRATFVREVVDQFLEGQSEAG